MTEVQNEDGLDTALARLLHEAEAIEFGTLRVCLEEVRRRRGDVPGASLAGLLIERKLVPAQTLDRLLTGLVEVPTLRPEETRSPTAPAQGQLGPYRLVREIARGGMGAVHEGVHEATGVHYAIKTLLPSADPEDSEEALRFQREAEVMAKLDHPHVARIHAAELDGPRPYLVQDLLSGGTLQDRLAEGPLGVEDAVAITAKLAAGLSHAHEHGILHRDLKPQNVLFDDEGRPKLVDFGLAWVSGAAQRLTQTGAVLGTPAYMAPEQASYQVKTSPATDVYGLGAVFYALLTGGPPFVGVGLYAVLDKVLHTSPEAPRALRPEIPGSVEAVCLRALAKKPSDRYADMETFRAALESSLDADARSPGRFRLALFGVCLLAVSVAVALAATPSSEPVPGDGTPEPGASTTPQTSATRVLVDTPSTPLERCVALLESGNLSEAARALGSSRPERALRNAINALEGVETKTAKLDQGKPLTVLDQQGPRDLFGDLLSAGNLAQKHFKGSGKELPNAFGLRAQRQLAKLGIALQLAAVGSAVALPEGWSEDAVSWSTDGLAELALARGTVLWTEPTQERPLKEAQIKGVLSEAEGASLQPFFQVIRGRLTAFVSGVHPRVFTWCEEAIDCIEADPGLQRLFIVPEWPIRRKLAEAFVALAWSRLCRDSSQTSVGIASALEHARAAQRAHFQDSRSELEAKQLLVIVLLFNRQREEARTRLEAIDQELGRTAHPDAERVTAILWADLMLAEHAELGRTEGPESALTRRKFVEVEQALERIQAIKGGAKVYDEVLTIAATFDVFASQARGQPSRTGRRRQIWNPSVAHPPLWLGGRARRTVVARP